MADATRIESALQLDDDELMDFFDALELDPGLLRAEIAAMDDDQLMDEYGLGEYAEEEETPESVRNELLAMSDRDLLFEHGSTTPQLLREELEGWRCLACQCWTDQEYYMLHDHVWLEVNPARKGMMCIGCVEERLGCKLTAEHFTQAPINSSANASKCTMRLNDRRGHDVTVSVDYPG